MDRIRGRIRTVLRQALVAVHADWLLVWRRRRAIESLALDEKYPYDIELKILRRLPVRGPMIDVGANFGSYSEALGDLVGQKRMILCEPLPDLGPQLRRKFPRARIVDAAVSDSEGHAEISIPEINGLAFDTRASLEAIEEHGQTGSRRLVVRTTTLDGLVKSEQLSSVGFIKIDVEGHEWSVLRGAEEVLASRRPLLLVEIECRHHDGPIEEVFSWLVQRRYVGFFVDPAPTLALRETQEFVAHVHQDVQAHQRREFQKYLNNFFFVPDEAATEFRERVTEILTVERRRLGFE